MIKNVFYCWLWISNGEQVWNGRHEMVKWSTVKSCIEERTSVLGLFVLQMFFWSLYDCNHAQCHKRIRCSWLCALDHECVPPLAYYAVLLRSTSKIIRNNFRDYFKIGVQRASWIYFTFTTIHWMTSITMSMRWPKLQKQKGSLFCNLRIFLWVCYITTNWLCRISIVIKLLGFWISSTFFARKACSQKFCRFVTINNGGCGFWLYLILINTNSYLSVSTNFSQHHLFCEPSFV